MKQIRLSKGLYTLVNDEDYDFLMQWTWCASEESRGQKWYAVRREVVNGKVIKKRMHRCIVEQRGVVIPDGMVVDHANHNSLDNRFFDHDKNCQQLEVITQAENMKRSPGFKQKGQRYAKKEHDTARETSAARETACANYR